MKKTILSTVVLTSILVGCSPSNETAQKEQAIPAQFREQALIATATPIPTARTLAVGTEVTLTGLVMGVSAPFVEGRGVFVLGDEATLVPCDAKGDDHCATPWDTCCDPIAIRQVGTATIQLLGADGKPLHQDVRGIQGLKELSRGTVTGVIAPNSTPDSLIVNASVLHVGVR